MIRLPHDKQPRTRELKPDEPSAVCPTCGETVPMHRSRGLEWGEPMGNCPTHGAFLIQSTPDGH